MSLTSSSAQFTRKGSNASNAASASSGARPSSGESVKVICRVRPFNAREIELQRQMNEHKAEWEREPTRSVIEMRGGDTIFLDANAGYTEKENFHFHESIWSVLPSQQESGNGFSDQADVMEKIGMPVVANTWEGYNSCLFAYGQTGSGKTHTMMGSTEAPGLIPRLCQKLFQSVQEQIARDAEDEKRDPNTLLNYEIKASFLEIYNEHVKDLLWDIGDKSDPEREKLDRANLKIRHVPGQGPYVVGLTTITVSDWAKCSQVIEEGTNNRSVAATKMNAESSRSHSIFKLTFTKTTKVISRKAHEKPTTFDRTSGINLVDLAGSERVRKSGAEGQRLKEAAAINQSLTTLKNVIDALVERRQIIPYRESALTWLLSESLGGNSKTYMISCVSPHLDNAEETLNTLRYALRSQGIQLRAVVNESDESRKIRELQEKLKGMKEAMEKGNTDELQLKYDETASQLEKAKDDAETKQREASELEGGIETEKKMKYRAFYANAFKIVLSKRLDAHMRAFQQQLVARTEVMQSELAEGEPEVAAKEERVMQLRSEEIVRREVMETSREEADGIKESCGALEKLKRQLLEKDELLQAKIGTLSRQAKFARFYRAANKFHIDKVHRGKLHTFANDLQERKDKVTTDIECSENEYMTRVLGHREEKTTKIAQLQAKIKEIKKQKQEMLVAKTDMINRLNHQTAFLEREMKSNAADFARQLSEVSSRHSMRYDKKREELFSLINKRNYEGEQSYNKALKDLNNRMSVWKRDCHDEREGIASDGAENIEKEKQRWEVAFEEERKQGATAIATINASNEELQSAIWQGELEEARYADLHNRVQDILDANPSLRQVCDPKKIAIVPAPSSAKVVTPLQLKGPDGTHRFGGLASSIPLKFNYDHSGGSRGVVDPVPSVGGTSSVPRSPRSHKKHRGSHSRSPRSSRGLSPRATSPRGLSPTSNGRSPSPNRVRYQPRQIYLPGENARMYLNARLDGPKKKHAFVGAGGTTQPGGRMSGR